MRSYEDEHIIRVGYKLIWFTLIYTYINKINNKKEKRIMSKKIDRTGEIKYNNQGLKMWIKKYRNSRDIDVEFEDGYIAHNKCYSWFEKGMIRNRNIKVVPKNRTYYT